MVLDTIELIEAIESISFTTGTEYLSYVYDTGYTGSSGVYAKITPIFQSSQKIVSILKDPKYSDIAIDELERDPHVTLVYSRENSLDLSKVIGCSGQSVKAKVVDVVYWGGHDSDGYIVLKLESDRLKQFNKIMVNAGAVHSFDDYTAHMTVNAKVGELTDTVTRWVNQAKIDLVDLELVFDKVSIEDIKKFTK
jgi:hypothetical protein